MIVVCSSGLNVPAQFVERYKLAITAQYLVIDETTYELDPGMPLAAIYGLLASAHEAPYLLGSTVDEFAELFGKLLERTNEILVIAGSRFGVGTYQAATIAAQLAIREKSGVTIRVVDTGLMELGAGLIAAYCGAAAQQGCSIDELATAAARLGATSTQFFAPSSLDAITASHRSGEPKVISKLGGDPPILQMKDGVISLSGYFHVPATMIATLRAAVESAVRPGTAVWVTIAYAGDDAAAQTLLAQLGETLDIHYALVRHLAAPGCIMLGPDSLSVSVHPVASMPFDVTLPTNASTSSRK